MTALLASVVASLAAWLLDRLLEGHVSETARYVVSFVVGSIVFVPAYIYVKRLRDQL